MIAGSTFISVALVALQIAIVIGSPETPTFNEGWQRQFDEESTRIDHFTLQNGKIQKVQMMTNSRWHFFNRLQHLPADIIFLNVDDPFSRMIVILPDRGVALNIVEEKLKRIPTSDLIGKSKATLLSLPKFKLDAALEAQYLPEDQDSWNVGMLDYNYKHIGGYKLSQQKAFLDVNERGVNTSLALQHGETSISYDRGEKYIRVDRPFIVILVEGYNVILQARIADPTNTSYILKTTGTAPTIETTTPANTEIPITPEFATTPGNPTDAPTTIEFDQTTKIFTDNGNEVTTIDSLNSTSEPEISTTVSPSTISIPKEIAPTVEPGQKIFIQSDKSGSLNPNQINEWIVNRIFNINRTESGSGSSRLLAELNFKQDSNVTQTELGKNKTSSEKTEFTWKFYN